MRKYEEAWIEQIITTSKIEAILKESAADTSFEGIKRVAIARFGRASVRVVQVPKTHRDWGSDREGWK